jgi:hypothetical protein
VRFRRAKHAEPDEILPVMVRASDSLGRVIAFGHPSALTKIGATIDQVPQPLVRGARVLLAAVSEFHATAAELDGAWLKLTPQARRLLDAHEAVQSGDGLIGVVRDARGKFAGQLTFVEPAAGTLVNAPALAATAALQMQLVAIERRLEAIHADLGYLITSAHLDVDAEVASNLDILDEVFKEVAVSRELTDTQWDRIVSIEASVRRLHHRSSGHLRQLEEALNAETSGLGEQVKRLKQAIQTNHSDLWLDLHLHAEKALTQWQSLYLLRQVDDQPERAAEFAGALKAEVTMRFAALLQLGDSIVRSLEASHRKSWTDRFRIISQTRLRHLLAELDQLLTSYHDGVKEIQLDTGSASALELSRFDVGEWRELGVVAKAKDTRVLEGIGRVATKVSGGSITRATLTAAGRLIERVRPTDGDAASPEQN